MPEMQMLQQIVISLVVVLMVVVIGLSISQTGVDMVGLESTDEMCATKDTVVTTIDSAFSWFPMLILSVIGGLSLFYVSKYLGWIGGGM